MTEGIIQKVIDKRILHYLNAMKGVQGFVAFTPKDVAEDFVDLEDELVREIEKEKHESLFVQDLERLHRIVFLDKLIGDNNE